ncbi:hypothetical protein D3C78_1970720 [compost metagenome]
MSCIVKAMKPLSESDFQKCMYSLIPSVPVHLLLGWKIKSMKRLNMLVFMN